MMKIKKLNNFLDTNCKYNKLIKFCCEYDDEKRPNIYNLISYFNSNFNEKIDIYQNINLDNNLISYDIDIKNYTNFICEKLDYQFNDINLIPKYKTFINNLAYKYKKIKNCKINNIILVCCWYLIYQFCHLQPIYTLKDLIPVFQKDFLIFENLKELSKVCNDILCTVEFEII